MSGIEGLPLHPRSVPDGQVRRPPPLPARYFEAMAGWFGTVLGPG